MRDDAAPGPLTQASAPQAPGRLAREDARNFGSRTLGSCREPQTDTGPRALLALNRDRAPVRADDVARNGEAEARPGGAGRPNEALEDVGEQFGWNPIARVRHRHPDSAVGRPDADLDGSPGRRMAQSVRDQVAEDAPDPCR